MARSALPEENAMKPRRVPARLALACALLVPCAAQGGGRVADDEREALARDILAHQERAPETERVAELLRRLELGMSALEKLGKHDLRARVQRVAEELRAQRRGRGDAPAAAPAAPDARRDANASAEREAREREVETVHARLRQMAQAAEVLAQSGDAAAAERVGRAMRARELAIAGEGSAAAAERAETPDRAELSALLARAAELLAAQGRKDRADGLSELSAVLADQARRVRALQEPGADARAEAGLADVRQRLEILSLVRAALAEAGREPAAERVSAALAYGKLLVNGANDARLAAAAADVPTLGQLSELAQVAAKLYAERGDARRAKLTGALALHYRERAGAADEESADEDADDVSEEDDDADADEEAEFEADDADDDEKRADDDDHERAPGLADLGRRLEIIRLARAAHAEAGWEGATAALDRALAFGRLVLEGASDETLAAHSTDVPSLPELSELLERAAGMHREWGHPDRADLCRELAAHYRSRSATDDDDEEAEEAEEAEEHEEHEDGEHADHDETDEHEHEPAPARDIDELAQRIEILRGARAAWAESGQAEPLAQIERFLHLAELQQAGASAEELGAAFEGLTTGLVIERLRGAAQLYRQWGLADRAESCNALAEFYAARWGVGTPATPATPATRAWNLDERADRVDILRFARAAHAEAGDEAAAGKLARLVEIGELQLTGGDPEAISALAVGPPPLDMRECTELVRAAGRRYTAWGNPERADLCRSLAEFYTARDTQLSAAESVPPIEPPAPAAREREYRALLEQLAALEAQMAKLKAEIEELRSVRRR
jgi:hypothetical protein